MNEQMDTEGQGQPEPDNQRFTSLCQDLFFRACKSQLREMVYDLAQTLAARGADEYDRDDLFNDTINIIAQALWRHHDEFPDWEKSTGPTVH